MTLRTRALRALAVGAVAGLGLLTVSSVAGADDVDHQPRDSSARASADMQRMHELMVSGNPGMQRMHELMVSGNPGMQRMHELMHGSPRTPAG